MSSLARHSWSLAVGLSLLIGSACAEIQPRTTVPREGWHTTLGRDDPLVGRVWSRKQGSFVDPAVLGRSVLSAKVVLLGESHDNPDHRRLQAEVIHWMLKAGRRPTVAFEMIDLDQQELVDQQLASTPGDPDALGRALAWDESGWETWESYRPVFAETVVAGLPIRATSLPREEAMEIARGTKQLSPDFIRRHQLETPLPEPLQRALVRDLERGHCNQLPEQMIDPMVKVQRARDARMADVILEALSRGPVVLVAGAGHARGDFGVPWYLRHHTKEALLSIGFMAVDADNDDVGDYRDELWEAFDFWIFTPRANDIDYCAGLKDKLKAAHGGE